MIQDLNDLENKIIKQLEYYFGDYNLPKDRFLYDLTGKEDGWIPIETLLTFNRLKALTTSNEDIVSSIKKSKSDLIELNETNDKIRRTKPLPEINEKFTKDVSSRTVHLKGFPSDSTLDEISEYCSKYGDVESISMRRFKDKKFKGCIFAIYKTVEAANDAVNSTDEFKEQKLTLRENKSDYFIRKRKNKVLKKENKLVNIKVDSNSNDENEVDGEKKEEENNKLTYESGCVIKLFELPGDITFKDIKPYFLQHSKVQYVDIFPETLTAIVRFASKNDLEKATENLGSNESTNEKEEDKEENEIDENSENKKDNSEENGLKKNENLKKLKLGENIFTYKILEGEEEKVYWKSIDNIKSLYSQKNRNFKKNKKKPFNRNKKVNNKKRPASETAENKAKQIKV